MEIWIVEVRKSFKQLLKQKKVEQTPSKRPVSLHGIKLVGDGGPSSKNGRIYVMGARIFLYISMAR